MKVCDVTCLVCYLYFGNRTWPGPAWSPAQTLSSLLISIQSLLNEKPYHNEPGFERKVSKSPLQLLVFSVMQFKIDQNKKSKPFNRLSPESEKRKKVDMQRLSPRIWSQHFLLWKICGERFSTNL